jgi:hypothetical protein
MLQEYLNNITTILPHAHTQSKHQVVHTQGIHSLYGEEAIDVNNVQYCKHSSKSLEQYTFN